MAFSSCWASALMIHKPAAATVSIRICSPERRVQQIRHVGDHLVGIDRLRRQRLLARERKQALREDGGALCRICCRVEKPRDI